MRTVAVVLSAAALTFACAHQRPPAAGAPEPVSEAEAGLAELLAGRTAGPPQECLNLSNLGNHRIAGTEVIVFESATDDLLWVNRLAAPCAGLVGSRALKIKSSTAQLCRGDTVTTLDPSTRVEYGACTLGEFVPYRRSK